MFSKSTEYSIRAIIFLAVQSAPHKLKGVSDIAGKLDFPEAFLGKVLQNLVKKNLVKSVKGPGGGFYLVEDTCKLTILNIVEILEGLDFLCKCGLGIHDCDDKNPCPIHNEYMPVKEGIKDALSSKTISKIKTEIAAGNYSIQFPLY